MIRNSATFKTHGFRRLISLVLLILFMISITRLTGLLSRDLAQDENVLTKVEQLDKEGISAVSLTALPFVFAIKHLIPGNEK